MVYRGRFYLLGPEELYETTGDVPNEVVPWGLMANVETGRRAIYYGAADTCVALAVARIEELLDSSKGGDGMKPMLRFQETFGEPNLFNSMETGLAIEDVWPSLYIGSDRLEEMRRKINGTDWAAAAYRRWLAEAETVLPETPAFTREPNGGRTGNAGRTRLFSDAGHHLLFDPACRSPLWDPWLKAFVEPHAGADVAWLVHQHERLRRLICSFGFLWRLSGDFRFASWAWSGLRDLTALYEETAAVHDKKAEPYRYVYGGLYEAQSQLLTLQALELLANVPGSEADTQRVREYVIQPGCEAIARWMNVMVVHNMSVWGMAALAIAGRFLGREDWIQTALHSERCGLRVLLERGIPRHAETGKPDGFWFEHCPFYSFFYVATPMTALVRVGEKASAMTADLRERFASLFEAPLLLVDHELRFLALSDRGGPDTMRLTQMRHVYEYAAGQVDAKYAPLLALLYEQCGAPRVGLTAVAFGPDQLPPPEPPPTLRQSGWLPEAGVATFRTETPKGGVTLWFTNLHRYPRTGQGHHHMDKLSISLHAFGEVVTSDLGWPGSESSESFRGPYLSGTFAHNTLLLDEYDQGAVRTEAFEARWDAPVPRVSGTIVGQAQDSLQTTFRRYHGARLKDGLYDDARISRTVWFDFPRIVLLDELEAETQKRFGFAFHARGLMKVRTIRGGEASPLAMPPLPEEGAWSFLRGRAHADPVAMLVADWRIRTDLFLRLLTVADSCMDAVWGSTPDNPAEILRGSVFLRTPGCRRRLASVIEVHSGTPGVCAIELGEGRRVYVREFSGTEHHYE